MKPHQQSFSTTSTQKSTTRRPNTAGGTSSPNPAFTGPANLFPPPSRHFSIGTVATLQTTTTYEGPGGDARGSENYKVTEEIQSNRGAKVAPAQSTSQYEEHFDIERERKIEQRLRRQVCLLRCLIIGMFLILIALTVVFLVFQEE